MPTFTKFTEEEIALWPQGHKQCRSCHRVLPFAAFHKNSRTLFGYNTICKECRKPVSKARWQNQSFERSMLASAKYRAKKKGVPFDLELEDIVIPEKCPVLGVPLSTERGSDYVPSLDRISPAKGYVKGNIIVMSHRANTLKSNMSTEEAKAVAKWMTKNTNSFSVNINGQRFHSDEEQRFIFEKQNIALQL